jgi:hypothetical protein
MLFFSTKCERMCMLQFALLSLLPGLSSHLETASHPELEEIAKPDPATVKQSARAELLSSFGQPLPIFSKGSFFSPYTPLQHLDMLGSYSTRSYVVGSTNALLLQQQSRYADIMVNLDTEPYSISIFSPSLKQASTLSAADRRWIDNLTQQVLDTWDPDNPSRPKNMGYAGSEEMIRLQFEEYILSLCSSMAYQVYRERTDGSVKDVFWKGDQGQETGVVSTQNETDAPELQEKQPANDENPPPKPPRPSADQQQSHPQHNSRAHQRTSSLDAHLLPNVDLGANALDFNPEFLAAWRDTRNFEFFIASLPENVTHPFSPTSAVMDTSRKPRIFDLIPPQHPTGGGLNIDDVQRRVAQGITDLRTNYKVDERLGEARENVGKALEAGKERVGRLWESIEERRRRAGGSQNENSRPSSVEGRGEAKVDGTDSAATTTSGGGSAAWTASIRERAAKVQKPDTAQLQQAAKENAAKAGAYLSSWGSWAKEKSRDWQQQQQAQKNKGMTGSSQVLGGGSTASASATASTTTATGTSATASAAPAEDSNAAAASAGSDALATSTAKPQRLSVGKFKEDID